LTSGSKIYPKLGKVNWSPEYDSANSSNLADSVRPLLFTNSAQNLNKIVTLKQENANTIDYQQEAPVVGTTTTLKFYTGLGTTNYYNVVMPTLTANKKTKYNFSLVAGVYGTADTTNSEYDLGVATVTIVGSPSGDITRVDTTASASLTPIAMQTYNSFLQRTGQVISIEGCCFKEFTIEIADETTESTCRGKSTGKTFKSRNISGTIVVENTSPLLYAFGFGNTLKESTIKVANELTGYGESDSVRVSSTTSTFDIGPTLKIASISVGECNSLSKTDINTGSALLDINTYHYNPTTGILTLSNKFNSGKMVIKIWQDQIVNKASFNYKFAQIETALQLRREQSKTGGTMIIDLKKVQLFAPTGAYDDDEGDTQEFTWSATVTSDDDGYYAFF
jgi:hypothetical protein